MNYEFDDKIPIYIQIINIIKKDIVLKVLKGGDKLPSVREMAEKYKVNPNTIQRVYQELERENITYTQRGTGTFITENDDKIVSIKNKMAEEFLNNYINGMEGLGFCPDEMIKSLKDYIDERKIDNGEHN